MIDQHLKFDWIPPSDRTPSQLKLTHEFHDQVGTFAKQGRFLSDPPERVILHELEIKVLGQLVWRIWQRSGSCVGCGGARAYCHAQLGDIAVRGDAEELKVPFPFATYGVGRELAGMNGPGEGSFGGAQAKAIEQFGMLPYDDPRLPQPEVKGGWATWTAKQEIQWSHPRGWPVKRSELEPDSTQHQIMTVTKASSIEDVVQGLAQSYGVTIACDFGTKPKVEGDVLLGRWLDTWLHQQDIAGYWKHPQLGLIFAVDNQWNDVHGDCPTLSKLGVNGSYWMLEKDLAKIIKSRDGEVYLHSNVEGFPLRKIDWGNMGIGS